MSEQEFKPGDVVRFKSGGPRMTVIGKADSGAVRCMWFKTDGVGPVQTEAFSPIILEHVPEEADAVPPVASVWLRVVDGTEAIRGEQSTATHAVTAEWCNWVCCLLGNEWPGQFTVWARAADGTKAEFVAIRGQDSFVRAFEVKSDMSDEAVVRVFQDAISSMPAPVWTGRAARDADGRCGK